MNTRLNYLYRDGANYKIWFYRVLSGTVPEERLTAFNRKHNGDAFYPALFGLSDTTFDDLGFQHYPDDPDFHEFASLEQTALEADTTLTAAAFMAKFRPLF